MEQKSQRAVKGLRRFQLHADRRTRIFCGVLAVRQSHRGNSRHASRDAKRALGASSSMIQMRSCAGRLQVNNGYNTFHVCAFVSYRDTLLLASCLYEIKKIPSCLSTYSACTCPACVLLVHMLIQLSACVCIHTVCVLVHFIIYLYVCLLHVELIRSNNSPA